MISLVQDTAQTLVEEELDVDQKDWVDDLLGVGYCVDSKWRKNSMQTRRTGLMICLVQDTAQTLVEEELNVDQKDWVDDLLGVGYCVDSKW